MAKTLSAALEEIEREQTDWFTCYECSEPAVVVELETRPEVANRDHLAITHKEGTAVGWWAGHAWCEEHRAGKAWKPKQRTPRKRKVRRAVAPKDETKTPAAAKPPEAGEETEAVEPVMVPSNESDEGLDKPEPVDPSEDLGTTPEGDLPFDPVFDTEPDGFEAGGGPLASLTAATPIVSKAEVREAQRLLKNNPYGDFWDLPITGLAGREFNAAVKRAKYDLGYPEKNIEPGFGGHIRGYLSGKMKLPAAYKVRRRNRLKQRQERQYKVKRKKMLAIAKTQLGKKEKPVNLVKYGKWFGANGQPWCAQFVSWCGVRAGFDDVFKRIGEGTRWAFCPFVEEAARDGKFGMKIVRDPQPGDIALYQFDTDSNADHIGIVEKGSRKMFTAIEGNTSLASNANGGQVMRRVRSEAVLRCFIRIVGP